MNYSSKKIKKNNKVSNTIFTLINGINSNNTKNGLLNDTSENIPCYNIKMIENYFNEYFLQISNPEKFKNYKFKNSYGFYARKKEIYSQVFLNF